MMALGIAGTEAADAAARHERMASVSLEGVRKAYGSVTALHATDLSIEAGEYLVLLGPSGSGKTTMLMMLAGFVQPTSGAILRDGIDITASPPERRGFGVVFQGYALFPHLTVAQNVAFPLKVRGMPRAQAEARVQQTLRLMRLQDFADRQPKQLSGGQQQRVALARALAFNPSLLLLDEPMSALDRKLKEELQAELKELHRRVGTTFVHITHDQDEAMALADRIAVMQDGRIVQIGAPRDIYRRPATRFVAGFLGQSNFLRGVVERSDAGGVALRVGAALLPAQAPATRALAAGEEVTIAVRPENLVVAPEGTGLRGIVTSELFFGRHVAVHVDVPGVGPLVAHVAADGELPPTGSAVGLHWLAGNGVVLHA
jgi:putative spermidine/putrescine transport system ATP-binding protein